LGEIAISVNWGSESCDKNSTRKQNRQTSNCLLWDQVLATLKRKKGAKRKTLKCLILSKRTSNTLRRLIFGNNHLKIYN